MAVARRGLRGVSCHHLPHSIRISAIFRVRLKKHCVVSVAAGDLFAGENGVRGAGEYSRSDRADAGRDGKPRGNDRRPCGSAVGSRHRCAMSNAPRATAYSLTSRYPSKSGRSGCCCRDKNTLFFLGAGGNSLFLGDNFEGLEIHSLAGLCLELYPDRFLDGLYGIKSAGLVRHGYSLSFVGHSKRLKGSPPP
jgi:hypothetical protein